MMPVHLYMDSSPQQRNQMPYPQHCLPHFGAVPSHIKVDPSNSPVRYESWPYGSDHGYSVPCHGYCDHGYFSGYYSFRPPCPYFAPAPSFHQCANYPMFPGAHPVFYVPPPHFSHEQPRYEYDKDTPRNFHFCGCPNHPCNQKNDSSLKIEEQEPDAERKVGDSVVPAESRNYQFPIVWIPPEYIKNITDRKPFDSEVRDWDKAPSDEANSTHEMKSFEREPKIWNGYLPLDKNGLKYLMRDEGGNKCQNQQSRDTIRQSQYPIFWMPYGNQDEAHDRDDRTMGAVPKYGEEAPDNFKFVPVKLPAGDGRTDKPHSNDENANAKIGADITEKNANKKIIPVKQVQPHKEENSEEVQMRGRGVTVERGEATTNGKPSRKPQANDEDGDTKSGADITERTAYQKIIPVKQIQPHKEEKSEEAQKRGTGVTVERGEGTANGKPWRTGAKRQSSSPPKTPKLPPVCLRVDPSPKKKNGNGSSRSLSPPKGQETLKDSSRTTAARGVEEDYIKDKQTQNGSSNKIKDVEPNKKVIRNIPVIEKRSEKNEGGGCTNGILESKTFDSQEEAFKKQNTESFEKDGNETKSVEGEKSTHEKDVAVKEATETKKASDNLAESKYADGKAQGKKLSDEEAAILIQSAYRGFEVRKWDPLKKLEQIAKVREKVIEVRNGIQALECCSGLQKDERQTLIIGEMIMSLLLKLDTIQGLHPSLRDIRKSLAKELVALQEKLDSLMNKQTRELVEESPTSKHADSDAIVVDTCGKVSMQETQNKELLCGEANSTPPICDNGDNETEPDQEHFSQMVDSKVVETADLPIVNLEAREKHENGAEEIQVISDLGCQTQESQPVMELIEGEATNGNAQALTEMQDENNVSPILARPVNFPSGTEQFSFENQEEESKLQMVGVDQAMLVNENSEENNLRIRPDETVNEVHIVAELKKQTENEKEEAKQGGAESNLSINSTSPVEVMPSQKDQEIDVLTELPLGVMDEEPAVFESEKCELLGKGEKVSWSGEEEYNVTADTASPVVGPTVSQSDVQLLKVDSDDWIKDVQEELPGDSAVEEKEQAHEKEISNDNEYPVLCEPEGVSSTVEEEESDKVDAEKGDHGIIQLDHAPFESDAGSVETQEKEVVFEENKQGIILQPVVAGVNEDQLESEKKTICQKPECVGVSDEKADLPLSGEASEEEVPAGKHAFSEPKEELGELGASFPVSSIASISSDERDKVHGRDDELVEENKRLKEMMEKLIEAGKEQLAVIADLSERVKDLEKKLPRKRLRKTKFGRARTAAFPG